MEEHGLPGTVRCYGTPAEEQGLGKVFMVRDGLFDDVDTCLSWHPSNDNEISVQPSKALRSFEVIFHGRSAHAAAAPWEGVSALDAIEAFGAGVNLLREHMPEPGRIHYVVTEGGEAPNVIPARARAWVYVRGKDWPECEKIFQHVARIVEGADLMAWGEEYGVAGAGFRPAEIHTFTGLYEYNINRTAAAAYQRNLELVGAPAFTDAEHQLAREIQRGFGLEETGMSTRIRPLDLERAPEPGGSTDVANISWVAPTVGLRVANWPAGCPAHSWASTAASGSPAALRAMITAATVMAYTGIDLLTDPAEVARIREEFERSRQGFDYDSPVAPDARPQLPHHMREGS
jgi:aminobenzoyl-glutamate utilization protein B